MRTVPTHRVAVLLGDLDNLAELGSGTGRGGLGELVKDVRHGTGEDALDLGDLVSGLEEVAQGRDDGQPGADGRFEVDESGSRSGLGLDNLVKELTRRREALLVRGDDRQAGRDRGRVQFGHAQVGSAIDQDGVSLGASVVAALLGISCETLDEFGRFGDGIGRGGVSRSFGQRGRRRRQEREEGLGVEGGRAGREVQSVLRVGQADDLEQARQGRREELMNDLAADEADADDGDRAGRHCQGWGSHFGQSRSSSRPAETYSLLVRVCWKRRKQTRFFSDGDTRRTCKGLQFRDSSCFLVTIHSRDTNSATKGIEARRCARAREEARQKREMRFA